MEPSYPNEQNVESRGCFLASDEDQLLHPWLPRRPGHPGAVPGANGKVSTILTLNIFRIPLLSNGVPFYLPDFSILDPVQFSNYL